MIHDLSKLSAKDPQFEYLHRGIHKNNLGITPWGNFKILYDDAIVKVGKNTVWTRHRIPAQDYNAFVVKRFLFDVVPKQSGGGVDENIRDAMGDVANVFKTVIEKLPIPRLLKDKLISQDALPCIPVPYQDWRSTN